MEPEGMASMARTARPGDVDEFVMEALLDILDNLLDEPRRFVGERPDVQSLKTDEGFVVAAERRQYVVVKLPYDFCFQLVGYRHDILREHSYDMR